jgi:hypothetical protein
MDNLNEWFYIILSVVAVISGILSSVKKRKRSEEVQRQRDINDGVPEAEWETAWETATPVPQPVRHPIQKTARTQLASDFLFKEGERTLSPAYSEIDKEKKNPESSVALEGDLQNVDELKKAIIYSEILNRKY